MCNDITAPAHHRAPRSVCACKCCLRRHTAHSINKWCAISSTWKHSASERSTQAFFFLSQDVKVSSVTGNCSRVTYMQEASSPRSAPLYKQLRKHGSLHGNRAEEGPQSFWLISRPEWEPELWHLNTTGIHLNACGRFSPGRFGVYQSIRDGPVSLSARNLIFLETHLIEKN